MTRLTIVGISFIVVSLMFAGISHAKIDKQNIMGIWLFDEGKGDAAEDYSGNGNIGKINGATWDKGKFGEALSFDGTDDWVEVPHSPTVSFDAGTSFTITVHYKGNQVGGALVGKNYEDTSQATPWYLLWDDGGRNQVTMYLRDEAGTSFTADSTSVVADDDWHFIAGVADASSGKISIWIDGEQESEADFNTGSGYGTSEGVFHIGRHYDRYTEGIIDDVGLFNTALDESDIKDLMNNGLSGITAVSSSGKLAAIWAEIKK
jgi:hypothetical protein